MIHAIYIETNCQISRTDIHNTLTTTYFDSYSLRYVRLIKNISFYVHTFKISLLSIVKKSTWLYRMKGDVIEKKKKRKKKKEKKKKYFDVEQFGKFVKNEKQNGFHTWL